MDAAYVAGKDSRMKYFGGCDAGSTYTKCVIIDENGKIAAAVTKRSRINPVLSAKDALDEAVSQVDGLNSAEELTYLIGTGYGRNKVPFADENISEISCHAMGVHVTAPSVKAIIDIGGQDVKGIAIDTDGTVLNFAMNDKCAAGTGRFFESMARAFEMSLDEFSNLSLTAKNVIPITAQCAVFAESEVISLVGEGKPMEEIAAGIQLSVAKRCFVMAKKAGAADSVTLTGGCAKNEGLKKAIEKVLKINVVDLPTDPNLWNYAYKKKVVLMSPTNLIAALRLALDLWKREYQEKNTQEIVKRGTALYEKLVSFTETFERIGETLKTASAAYDTALGQLSAGKGNVIRQAEMLKELGITPKKKLSSRLISQDEDKDESE